MKDKKAYGQFLGENGKSVCSTYFYLSLFKDIYTVNI